MRLFFFVQYLLPLFVILFLGDGSFVQCLFKVNQLLTGGGLVARALDLNLCFAPAARRGTAPSKACQTQDHDGYQKSLHRCHYLFLPMHRINAP